MLYVNRIFDYMEQYMIIYNYKIHLFILAITQSPVHSNLNFFTFNYSQVVLSEKQPNLLCIF